MSEDTIIALVAIPCGAIVFCAYLYFLYKMMGPK